MNMQILHPAVPAAVAPDLTLAVRRLLAAGSDDGVFCNGVALLQYIKLCEAAGATFVPTTVDDLRAYLANPAGWLAKAEKLWAEIQALQRIA